MFCKAVEYISTDKVVVLYCRRVWLLLHRSVEDRRPAGFVLVQIDELRGLWAILFADNIFQNSFVVGQVFESVAEGYC